MASTKAFNLMADLAECLRDQIIADDSVMPCFLGLVPGQQAQSGYTRHCDEGAEDCGMAWVRLATAFPMVTLGEPDTTPGNCSQGLGISVEMGIMRCFPVEEDGYDVPADVLLEKTDQQLIDMMSMYRALRCCSKKFEFILGAYVPAGPQGGYLGGMWTLTLAV